MGSRSDPERTKRMADMYAQGVTLANIGAQFGVSRQCIQQLLRRAGVDPKSGGHAQRARLKREGQLPKAHVFSQRLGVTREVWEMASAAGLIGAFRSQANASKNRGIQFSLTFGQWLAIWQASGKLDQRGRGHGKYCMSRIKDSGGYELGNVHIQPCEQNSREAVDKWVGKKKPIRGVFCLFPGSARPWVARCGKHQVGRFATMEEAGAARERYVSETGARVSNLGTGRGWTLVSKRKSKPYRVQVAGTKNTYHATSEEARAEYVRRCAEVAALAIPA